MPLSSTTGKLHSFVNGNLKETVFMATAPGMRVAPDIACHLKHSIYGLKLAAIVCHNLIRAVFLAITFRQCVADVCGPVYVVLYVDDLQLDVQTTQTLLTSNKI